MLFRSSAARISPSPKGLQRRGTWPTRTSPLRCLVSLLTAQRSEPRQCRIMVGGQNFFHSQEKEKEWVYVMIGVRQTECPASHVRTWWCDLVWHCTILWSVISLCGKYNVTFCLVVFLIKFNRFYNCLASDLTLFQGRSRTRHLKLHVVFLVRFLSNILMSSLQEECKPWQCLCVWHLMNLLGFMVCVPVHCYELVIGFECSISSTCLPQENTDRVQREWACTECRGSGRVVSAEGVGV